jgi:hypothetical protein
MKKETESAKIVYRNYIQRFFIHPVSAQANLPEADMYVVIPSYGEEELERTLTSLAVCPILSARVCVVVVVNDKENESPQIRRLGDDSLALVADFASRCPGVSWVAIDALGLKDKNAGVGLARKIGMDAVVLRCVETGENPVLICLDGDCLVSSDYLLRLETEFLNSQAQVAVLEFSHRIEESPDPDLETGIGQYELFLEYYRLALHSAGYPFFYHTVGSSMACKALAYARSGGMNQRKAGEDFYFLHKLFPHYQTIEISGAMVFPSPRISVRVPFGTGRFQMNWKEKGALIHETYHPEVFSILSGFLKACFRFLESPGAETEGIFHTFFGSHSLSRSWFQEFEAAKNLTAVLNSSGKPDQRKKAFFRWFDGLRVLRFVHYFSAAFPKVAPAEGIACLLPEPNPENETESLVLRVRKYLAENPVRPDV